MKCLSGHYAFFVAPGDTTKPPYQRLFSKWLNLTACLFLALKVRLIASRSSTPEISLKSGDFSKSVGFR